MRNKFIISLLISFCAQSCSFYDLLDILGCVPCKRKPAGYFGRTNQKPSQRRKIVHDSSSDSASSTGVQDPELAFSGGMVGLRSKKK